jgi:hypothetical protein
MARRVRLRLLGDGWFAYGGAEIPEDRVVEVPEAEAAELLRDRSSARRVEVLGWVDNDGEKDPPERFYSE